MFNLTFLALARFLECHRDGSAEYPITSHMLLDPDPARRCGAINTV